MFRFIPMTRALVLAMLLCTCLGKNALSRGRSFVIDYENGMFLKDGAPFRFVSGSLHYFRVPKAYWMDRLVNMKMAGLNVLHTYVEWSGHEPEPGAYNFENEYDLEEFLDMADDLGFLVMFRPGPYICAERDNGGLPYWLLREHPHMKYRSSHPAYLNAVDRFFNYLLNMMKPYLYKNGGPIISVQVENEYGSYPECDKDYMLHLVELIQKHIGADVPLFRSNQADESLFDCDNVRDTLPTINMKHDFNSSRALEIVRNSLKKNGKNKGPFVVTEYYSGWMDHWGEPHANVDPAEVAKTFDELMNLGASVNFYMFHGGTNFGFTSGSSPPIVPTSYDYDAPLSEDGDPTPMYYMLRNVTSKYMPLPPGETPRPKPKMRLGSVPLTQSITLEQVLKRFRRHKLLRAATSDMPKTFEELGQDYGYLVYTTIVDFQPKKQEMLTVDGLKDRGYVYTETSRHILSRVDNQLSVPITIKKGGRLKIIVENQGRTNFGLRNHDVKGITSRVTLGERTLRGWTTEAVPITQVDDICEILNVVKNTRYGEVPGFFYGTFGLPEGTKPLDTFLEPIGWTKGVAFVNGINLGRYWPKKGPQVTLYVPASFLLPFPSENTVLLFEMEEGPTEDPQVKFHKRPVLNRLTRNENDTNG